MKSLIKGFFIRHFTAALTGVLLVATFFITGGMIRSIKGNISEFEMVTSPANASNKAVMASVGDEYIVREYEGRIGVFQAGETIPEKVVQVYVMYLPEADRAALRAGISVSGKDKLEALIEDLRS